MNSWLSSLKDLLALNIKLSLPGLLTTALLVVVFWPAKPIDVIPVVHSTVLQYDPPHEVTVGPVRMAHTPIEGISDCSVDEYYLDPPPKGILGIFALSNRRSQLRQFALEQQGEYLDQCLADEKRLVGKEQSENAYLEDHRTATEAWRASEATLAASYERSGGPLLPQTSERIGAVEKLIENDYEQIAIREQVIRDRQWEIPFNRRCVWRSGAI
jgi:hypothetical protein